MSVCVYPSCEEVATRDVWCSPHWGFFPHDCEYPGCDSRPVFDDEPMCFVHSPDEGSSVRGYSAYKKALGVSQ